MSRKSSLISVDKKRRKNLTSITKKIVMSILVRESQ